MKIGFLGRLQKGKEAEGGKETIGEMIARAEKIIKKLEEEGGEFNLARESKPPFYLRYDKEGKIFFTIGRDPPEARIDLSRGEAVTTVVSSLGLGGL